MNFKSLNESILSVTNPQSKLVKEGLLGKLKKKVSRFGQAVARHADDDKPLSQELASKREAPKGKESSWMYGGVRRDARDARRLRNSKGVLESKSGLVEEQRYIEEYIELLEFALEAIAEELECDVEDLLEDIQTRERQVQMKRKLKRSDNLVGKANAEVNKRERAEDRAYSNLSADDDFLKVAKTSDRADTARDNRERTDKTHSSLVNLNSRERKSKKLFGKGGKVIKKATVKEEQEYIERLESALESIAEELECSVEDLLEETKKTAQLSPKQRAAAMKDRNSRIHRTPAELKAHDAGMKAYVKSQNNMTDSKGKKLHPYDDYQS